MKYIVTTEDEWHKLRNKYITASEAAVLVGLNPYSSPKKVRDGKIKQEFFGNAFTRVGQVLEPVVVEVTNEVLDKKFKLYEDKHKGKVFFTKNHLGATPDAYEGKVLLECKTTRPHTYLKYSAVPPNTYLIQLQVQMYCTGTTKGYLAILSTDLTQPTPELNWPITIYEVKKMKPICDILKEESERFITNEKFRVKSEYKKRVQLLLSMCYTKI